jgi:hypothetical protein
MPAKKPDETETPPVTEPTIPPDAAPDAPAEGDTTTTGDEGDDEGEKPPAFYCPGCGRMYGYQRECTGSSEAPHPPIEVVSTDELSGDPEGHTPAPSSA